jgi:hypothetical protein
MPLADHDPRSTGTRGFPCSVKVLLTEMPEHDRNTFAAWLDDVSMTQGGIWKALKSEGYDCSQQQIGRHRRRECRCATG